MNKQNTFCIGIDVGGSKTKAFSGFEDNNIQEWSAPGANPSRLGFELSRDIIAELLNRILGSQEQNISAVSVELGIAGIGGSAQRMKSELSQTISNYCDEQFIQVACASDIDLIGRVDLGSRGGISVTLGTGSSFLAIAKDSQIFQGGGWGFLLGDEGSGFSISASAIKHALAKLDGKVEDEFTKELLIKTDLKSRSELVKFVYEKRDELQHLVSWIAERSQDGDILAEELIRNDLRNLVGRIEDFISDLTLDLEPRMILNGGLASVPEISKLFQSVLSESKFRHWELTLSQQEPARGAWKLAAKRS